MWYISIFARQCFYFVHLRLKGEQTLGLGTRRLENWYLSYVICIIHALSNDTWVLLWSIIWKNEVEMGVFVRSAMLTARKMIHCLFLLHIRALIALFYIKIRLMYFCMLTPLYSHCFLDCYMFQPSWGLSGRFIDTFNEPGQQNSCQYWTFHFLPHRKHTAFPWQRSVT